MAQGLVEEAYLSAIASAIRGKNGLATTYTPSQMAGAISAIPTGGSDQTGLLAEGKIISFSNSTIASLKSYAFAGCLSLETVLAPNVSIIGVSAFYMCRKLSVVDFDNCSYVHSSAFRNCSVLQTISLPKLTNISAGAFGYCYNLISLYLMSTKVVSLMSTNAFTTTPISTYSASAGRFGSIYVPSSLYATYIASTNWVNFSSRFVSM